MSLRCFFLFVAISMTSLFSEVFVEDSCRYIYDEDQRLQSVEKNGIEVLSYEYNTQGVDVLIRSTNFVYWLRKGEDRLDYGDWMSGESGYRLYDPLGRCIYEKFLHGISLEIEYMEAGKRFSLENLGSFVIEAEGTEYQISLEGRTSKLFCPQLPLKGEILERDERGNILSVAFGSEVCFYSYDEQDRLIETSDKFPSTEVMTDDLERVVRLSSHAGEMDCRYDPFGRMISSTFSGKPRSDYIYFDYFEIGRVEEEELKEFRLLAPSVETTDPFPMTVYLYKEGSEYFVESDFLGNVISLQEVTCEGGANGDAVERIEYSPFKEEYLEERYISPWRYHSQRFFPEVGLTLHGIRFYDPNQRQYVSLDPTGYDVSLDRTHFCLGNPLKYVDPIGTHIGWRLSRQEKVYVGMLLDFVGEYFPFPLEMGEYLRRLGADFRGVEPPQLFEESQLFELGGEFEEDELGVIYVNGICTPKYLATHTGLHLSQKFQRKISCVHIATEGFGRDLVQAALERLSIKTKGVLLLKNQLRSALKKPYKMIVVICHSRGALATDLAVQGLTEEERKRVQIHALGPAKFLRKSHASKVVNYVSKNDPVARLLSLLGLIFGDEHKLSKVIYLDVVMGGEWVIDHAMNGGTYKKALDVIVKEVLHEYSLIN